MDISKASNFERYVFDIVSRDPVVVRELWTRIANEGGFDLAGTPYWANVAASGFVSGASTHADRIATIRATYAQSGIVLDPHTADGVGVGRRLRDPAVPLVCVETALPAKFAATIREALGRDPERPAAYADLESRPQRCDVLPADAAACEELHRGARQGGRLSALANLGRNLIAGLRLALFLRVSRLAFRIDLAQLLLLFIVSASIDFGVDWIVVGEDARFTWLGAGGEFFSAGLLILLAVVQALLFRERALALAIPVLAYAAYPVIQVAHALPGFVPALFARLPTWADDVFDDRAAGLGARPVHPCCGGRAWPRAAASPAVRRAGGADDHGDHRAFANDARHAGLVASGVGAARRSLPESGFGACARRAGDAARRRAVESRGRNGRRDRPLFRGLRQRRARRDLSSGHPCRAARHGRALGHARPLGRAGRTAPRRCSTRRWRRSRTCANR